MLLQGGSSSEGGSVYYRFITSAAPVFQWTPPRKVRVTGIYSQNLGNNLCISRSANITWAYINNLTTGQMVDGGQVLFFTSSLTGSIMHTGWNFIVDPVNRQSVFINPAGVSNGIFGLYYDLVA